MLLIETTITICKLRLRTLLLFNKATQIPVPYPLYITENQSVLSKCPLF